MTLLYADGFGGFGTGNRTVLDPNYDFATSVSTSEAGVFAPGAGNPSPKAAFTHENVGGGLTAGADGMLLATGGLSSDSTWIVGRRFRCDDPEFENTDSRAAVLIFYDSEMDEQVRIYARAGTLTARVGQTGTLLGVADLSIVSRVWYYLECKIVFDSSTGSIELKIHEEQVMNLTGINTASTATGQTRPYQVLLVGGSKKRHEVDDVYICDGVDATATQGQPYDDFLGDIGLKTLRPNGNGNSSQLNGSDGDSTDNYLLVDEDGPDDDTTYVETTTVGNKDTYAFENLSSTPAQIEACVVKSYARKTDSGTRSFVHVARSSTTESDSDAISPGETYQFHPSIYTEDPNTSARWTESGVNAAEFGVKLAS